MSNSISIYHQGEKVKYYIDIADVTGFTQQSDNFRVILRYGMEGGELTIEKSQMFTNEDGRYFFLFDTAKMVGKVHIECQMDVPDTDYSGDIRTEIDRQMLCYVAATTCPQLLICDACTGTHKVTYTRTQESSMQATYEYLCDADGNHLCTTERNGEHREILVLRT